jgi:hypothetical protein
MLATVRYLRPSYLCLYAAFTTNLHRGNDEKKWWEAAKIEPMEIAQRLWRETRHTGMILMRPL